MRKLLSVTLILAALAVLASEGLRADEKEKQAPAIVLKSADGKNSVDLQKMFNEGPVLVRLTCACSGCDQELAFFQKLQTAYNGKGLQTVAVFREAPEAASNYAVKKDLKFSWLSDPKGELWKTFGTTAMPANILIDKGGKVVKVVTGCNKEGKNAQALSAEISKLLKIDEAVVVEPKSSK
jgi:peroxiredoxin